MSIINGIESGNLEEVKISVKKNKSNLKVHSKRYNKSPFELAVDRDQVEIVEFMLDFMVENRMSYLHNRTGGKVMMSTVKSLEMAKLLFRYKFPIEDEYGASVINGLIEQNRFSNKVELVSIIEFVISHGARVNMSDVNNWSPLMNACTSNLIEVMELLVNHGADINFSDWNGRSIIDIISQPKTIEKFISFGPKLTLRQLDQLGAKHPDILLTHPNISDYVEQLISIGREDAIPSSVKDIFLF